MSMLMDSINVQPDGKPVEVNLGPMKTASFKVNHAYGTQAQMGSVSQQDMPNQFQGALSIYSDDPDFLKLGATYLITVTRIEA